MIGIVIGGIIGVVAAVVVIAVSCAEIRRAKSARYICPKCGNEFSPRSAFGSVLNFGDGSNVVTCSHCGHRDRMIPQRNEK